MLDPISALAFEMQAVPGVFALLLGSGISRAAKIPTGWEITLDLVRQVATLNGLKPEGDPAAWYAKTYGKPPDYSEMLDQLASTPSLRQAIVRPYLEPDDAERSRGEKCPTDAHRAIATLISKGYLRVVLTTNFDPLLEQACAEVGQPLVVVSSADQIAGSVPLVHAGPMLVKLHGDYLDTRIRNTFAELSSYDPAVDILLDRILDEFGLVVCGWSGDWDIALKAAIDRSPNRRFPTVWATRGEPSAQAQALVSRRGARVVPIADADSFFSTLRDQIEAIELFKRPHPDSAEVAAQMLKEYLSDPRKEIGLHDFVLEEFRRATVRLESLGYTSDRFSDETYLQQVKGYQAAVEPLLPLAFIAGRWCNEEQARAWHDLIAALAQRRREQAGIVALIELRVLPAMLMFYSFALGAGAGTRPQNMGVLAARVEDVGDIRGALALGDRLNIAILMGTNGVDKLFRRLPLCDGKTLPGSHYIASVLRPILTQYFLNANAFDEAFARVEIALSVGFAERMTNAHPSDRFWVPGALVALDKERLDRIAFEWKNDFAERANESRGSQLAGTAKAPRIDEVVNHYARLWTGM